MLISAHCMVDFSFVICLKHVKDQHHYIEGAIITASEVLPYLCMYFNILLWHVYELIKNFKYYVTVYFMNCVG